MDSAYWNPQKMLTYDKLFNFIIGARGVGKTYGIKTFLINRFKKYGEEFVYLRRYSTEVNEIKTFFDDIDTEDNLIVTPNKKFMIDDKLMGHTWVLSKAKIKKSVPMPKVKWIFFDEFLIDKGTYHYIPDEVTNFLEMYSTIARTRDVKVFFCSNATTELNPYFLYFDLRAPKDGEEFFVKDDILVHRPNSDLYVKKVLNTRFGKLMQNTRYFDYAFKNQFLRDDSNFVELKTGNSRYLFTMMYKGEKIGVWSDYITGKIYLSYDVDPSCKLIYSMTMDDHTINTMLTKNNKSSLIKFFIESYMNAQVRFENSKLQNLCRELLGRIL